MGVTSLVFELLALKAKIKGVFESFTVAMVTYYVTTIIISCSLMIGHLFDAFILTSTDI